MSAARAAAAPQRAHVVADDAEALAVARAIAADVAVEAAARDAERRLPHAELRALAASGLLGVTVPRELGGADVSAATLAEVFRLLAAADPNVAQIPQSHYVYVNVLKQQGSAAQQALLLGAVLGGAQIANAQSERGTKHVQDIRTRLVPAAGGDFVLRGVKHYSTGALFADWIGVLARAEDDALHVAYVPAGAPGLEVVDDWDGMGQRTTASGTVRLDDVPVSSVHVVPHHRTFEGPQLHGAQAQLLHAAIDVGIAGGALAEAAAFVREHSRPWFEAEVEAASEDPLTIQRFGELAVELRGAEALLRAAGEAVDAARARLTDASAAEASIAVAVAKAAADRAAVTLTNGLFEVAGTRAALAPLNLDRHWRNARTHTLHDPVRWKVQHIGRHVLNGTPPPRHGLL